MPPIKPTPAPWTYAGGEVLDAQRNQICQLYDSFRNPAEDDANGVLMAAAPTLLSSLKETLEIAARNEAGGFVLRARVAIDRAEGRT